MPRRRSRSPEEDSETPEAGEAEETEAAEAEAAAADPEAPAAEATEASEPEASPEPAAAAAAAEVATAAPAAKAGKAGKASAPKAAPVAPRPAYGAAASHSGAYGPYADDAGLLYRIFGSAGGLADAAGEASIDADDSTTLHDGGIAAFALQDLSGNRMGTVLSFQRQPGGARLFDFDPGFVYWRWDRDKWGKRFRLVPLAGTVGLGFTDPPRWEITGAYPFNGGTDRALPGVPARGRLWRVSVVDASGKAKAQDIYLWRVDGGPIRLHQWYGRASSIRAAAWLELAAGESLLFEAVEDAAAVDAAADFQVLVLPEAP